MESSRGGFFLNCLTQEEKVATLGVIMSSTKILRRSRTNRVIAGVCGGFAERFGWNAMFLRFLFVVGSFLPIIPGFIVYIILWILLPEEE